MLIAGQLVVEHAPGSAPGSVKTIAGQVRIDAGRIVELSLGAPIGTPDLGGDDCLISPGFIDAHVHLPQMDCIGIDGLTLLDWLETAVFPTEARWENPDFAAQRAVMAGRRLLAAGTTGIAAYATVHHAAAIEAIRAIGGLGLRGYVGQVLLDQHAPAELCRPARQLLEEAQRLTPYGRIQPAVTPRFAVSCSDELLRGAGALAKATGWAVQTHLSETLDECRLVGRLHPSGSSYTDVYGRAGLLTPRTILGHGIHLSPVERATIARAGSTIAHCPTANLFLQAGMMDRAGHRSDGITIALGSDIAGGPDVCMVRVARAMIETAKARRLGDETTIVPTPAEAWWQITAGNADALGWADAGRIRVGAAADLVVIRPSRTPLLGQAQATWRTSTDPISALMYGFDERWIEAVVVNGMIVE